MMADINKDTVDFGPNYDEVKRNPLVLPSRIPRSLSTVLRGDRRRHGHEYSPHSLREVVDGLEAMLDHPDITIPELMKSISKVLISPPTAVSMGKRGIVDAYTTGSGTIRVRGKAMWRKLATENPKSLLRKFPTRSIKEPH